MTNHKNRHETASESSARKDALQRLISIEVCFGEFTISTMDNDSVWLSHESGEGMQVWNSDFERMLRKFWDENF